MANAVEWAIDDTKYNKNPRSQKANRILIKVDGITTQWIQMDITN
jgi:hypothetical protein